MSIEGNLNLNGFSISGEFVDAHRYSNADDLPISISLYGEFVNYSWAEDLNLSLSLVSECQESNKLLIDLFLDGWAERAPGAYSRDIIVDISVFGETPEINKSIAYILLDDIEINSVLLPKLKGALLFKGFDISSSMVVENNSNANVKLGYINILGETLGETFYNGNIGIDLNVNSALADIYLANSKLTLNINVQCNALSIFKSNSNIITDLISVDGKLSLYLYNVLVKDIDLDLEVWGVCL